MILILVTAVAISFISWLYLRWTRVRSYWADRKVPYLSPHPLFGSLTFLQKQNAGLWMRDMYFRFKTSPYFGIWLFWRPALVINCPEIGKNILIKDADIFRNRFLSSGKTDPIGGLNLFTVNDPLWTSVRKRLTPSFTSSKLRALHGLVSTKANQLVERIRRDTDAGKIIDLRTVYADYTTDVIGISAFGVKSDAIITGESHIRNVTKEFQAFSIFRGLAWTSIFFLPGVVDFFRFSLFPKTSTDYFSKVFHAITVQRRNDGIEHKDLLDALLKIKRDAKNNNEEITDEMLIAQAAIFLQGGFDTSAVTLTFMTYELAYKPEVQEKLYKELLEAKERIGARELHSDDLVNLPYANAVMKEVLRFYPPMGFLDRIADRDYKVDENLTIPAGTPVYVNGIGMQYDPDYFPDPMTFNPDRFMPENEHNLTPFTFLPFGDGPRSCIGERFAYTTIRYAMAAIFLNFEVQPLPNSKKPSECEIEKKGIFLMPSGVMSVKYIPRT